MSEQIQSEPQSKPQSETSFIRNAATVMLVRPAPRGEPDEERSGAVPREASNEEMKESYQLYMMLRPKELRSFSGVWVFPGGSVDLEDKDVQWQEYLSPFNVDEATRQAVRRDKGSPAIATQEFRKRMAKAFQERHNGRIFPDDPIPDASRDPKANFIVWVTALRELFEESGTLLVRETDRLPDIEELREARRLLRRDEMLFLDFLKKYDLHPDLDAMRYIGRLLTPSTEKRRFDTRFFLVRLPEGVDVDGIHGAPEEAVEEGWFSPHELLENASGRFEIIPPTRFAIGTVAGYHSIDELWQVFE